MDFTRKEKYGIISFVTVMQQILENAFSDIYEQKRDIWRAIISNNINRIINLNKRFTK